MRQLSVNRAPASQPGQSLNNVGDILAVELLTEQSPFLDWSDPVQQQSGISDEAYEMIPSQVLSRLRADSIGSAILNNGQAVVSFTGGDGHAYVLQSSFNLVDWFNVSTNNPANGIFRCPQSPANHPQFYRTLLLQ